MITKEEIIEILENAVLDTLNKTDGFSYGFDDAADAILKRISWKPMSTAPKNRPIAVYNIPSADEFGFTDEPDGTVVVVWVPDDGGWMIHGSEFNTDGSYPRISNPRAWMETPVYVI